MDVTVGVVVVTHDSAQVLPGLIASMNEYEPDVEVVVVDSGSTTGAPQVEGHDVTALERNVGYATACNAGAERLRDVDILAFLNPDVRLTGPSLTELGRQLRTRPAVGVATGPLVDERGRRVPSAWGPPSAARALWVASGLQLPHVRRLVGRLRTGGALTSGASTAVDELRVDGYVVGGAMVVRRACWEELGGFDEEFFLFGEDADLCARARKRGWEVWVLPCTPLVHLRGGSTPGVTDAQRRTWYLEGARRYARKHYDPSVARRLDVAHRLGSVLRRVRRLDRPSRS